MWDSNPTPKTGDPRIVRLLGRLNVKYTVDEDGDFNVVVRLNEQGRQQRAFINSQTYRLGELELRRVWSVALMLDGPPPQKTMLRLLTDNSRSKIGAWMVIPRGDFQHLIAFSVPLAAEPNGDALMLALMAVLTTTDTMEAELTTGGDIH